MHRGLEAAKTIFTDTSSKFKSYLSNDVQLDVLLDDSSNMHIDSDTNTNYDSDSSDLDSDDTYTDLQLDMFIA